MGTARKIDDIKQQMVEAKDADTLLAAYLTTTSRRSIFGNFFYIVASAIGIHEQLWDEAESRMENLIEHASPASEAWIRDKMLKFQYDATNPQVAQMIDLVPQYPVVDETLRIITRCSVNTMLGGSVSVKVAKDNSALDSLELSAAQAYLDILGIPGIKYNAFSAPADKLFVAAQIYYNGQYSQVISAAVQQAIANYCASIDFNGNFVLSDLELAIKAVPGVKDVLFKNVRTRDDNTLLANAAYLVKNQTVTSRVWPTVAGWIIPETTAGSTLADTLELIPA